ncbi:hypothetical protein J437_LFUL005927 [Ladona fulva]|uniref:Lipase domain-containing protein n=1 Tax=Ladona fulva TaxID=123851 RepID=A0A8K0KF93_LADFU|nr:hypothetical protein J437_LFUL005927 [Ladona fulva]
MKQTNRMNIILVDWHVLSAGPWYPWAVLNVPVVGRYLAYFIDSLARRIDQKGYGDVEYDNEIIRRKRLSSSSSEFFQNLHVVGFSLGAHVAGVAGYHVTEGRIGRITGIEPAYPMVNLLATNAERLDSSDAEFVDVIHTCSGSYGVPEPVGHVDFYPNGGEAIQPGCENVIAKCEQSPRYLMLLISICDTLQG